MPAVQCGFAIHHPERGSRIERAGPPVRETLNRKRKIGVCGARQVSRGPIAREARVRSQEPTDIRAFGDAAHPLPGRLMRSSLPGGGAVLRRRRRQPRPILCAASTSPSRSILGFTLSRPDRTGPALAVADPVFRLADFGGATASPFDPGKMAPSFVSRSQRNRWFGATPAMIDADVEVVGGTVGLAYCGTRGVVKGQARTCLGGGDAALMRA